MPHALYPIFLLMSGRRAVIAGGGSVALRKARGLLAAGARVTIVAPSITPPLRRLPVTVLVTRFRPSHLAGAALAFAATDDRAVNAAIASAARARRVPVNIADDPAGSDFHVPAVARAGSLAVAISTSGRSPAGAVLVRNSLRPRLPALARRAAAAGKKR